MGKGDRVAVMLGNGWEFGVGTYAIWKLGGVLVGFVLFLGLRGGCLDFISTGEGVRPDGCWDGCWGDDWERK